MDQNYSNKEIMTIEENSINALRAILEGGKKNIVMIAHTNPDGDAIGSLLAWHKILLKQRMDSTMIVPNRYPDFLEGMKDCDQIKNFKNDKNGNKAQKVLDADIIFCLDFNQISRLDALGEVVAKNTKATKILIDHHLSPPDIYDLQFSFPESSSTCFLVYKIVEKLYGTELIDRDIAEVLYVGMMTDTGNFSFGNLSSDLYLALNVLVGTGLDIPKIHRSVYDNFSEGRMRLLGYTINDKMTILEPHRVAYMTLSEEELRRFNFQLGDSEGFVNYPLSIKDVNMSVLFTENQSHIKISFRSQGDVDVNAFARRYFDGGGHKNASGGKSFKSMEQTVEYFKQSVSEFFS